MLQKLGVDDNVSFYNGNCGKQDFILNVVWHKAFLGDIQNHLSAIKNGVRLKTSSAQDKIFTIEDCFKEFNKPELLDDDNKWYCNKCKDHV